MKGLKNKRKKIISKSGYYQKAKLGIISNKSNAKKIRCASELRKCKLIHKHGNIFINFIEYKKGCTYATKRCQKTKHCQWRAFFCRVLACKLDA